MGPFTRAQAAKLLDVPPRKLEAWVARGVLRPEGRPRGSGVPRCFTFAEVVRAKMLYETQENLGAGFIRPGSLSKALHDQVTDAEIERECHRIERGINSSARPIDHRIAGEGEDLLVYLYRSLNEQGDGTVSRGDELIVAKMKRTGELGSSSVLASIQIELSRIVRILTHKADRIRRLAALKAPWR